MLDASGKIPDGIMGGNFNALGSYRSCIDIKATNPKTSTTFHGRFAGVIIGAEGSTLDTLPFNFLYGICLPDSCTDEDLRILLSTNHISKTSIKYESYQLDAADIIMV